MTTNTSMKLSLCATFCLLGATFLAPVDVAEAARGGARAQGQTSVNRPAANAQRGGSGGANRGSASSSSRSVERSREVSRTTNVDVDVDGHHGGCCDDDWGDGDLDDNPLARGMVVAGTVAAIGSIVRQPPANCVPVAHGNVTYQQCGSTWYQPQYAGSNVQYVVVAPPY
jgi:hypothetical protein